MLKISKLIISKIVKENQGIFWGMFKEYSICGMESSRLIN
jgi:hypothetical protein